ncbi:ABC transporter B family member 20 [Linum perenne]
MHRKASLVLEDAIRNIYIVVAFRVGAKVMELYRLQLQKILKRSFLHALKPPNVYGSIELKNVDFCYLTHPELLVLRNFSLKISGEQTVAVVGVSGSGKSTIISLIEGFYDPVAGQILLDGRDLKLYNLRWQKQRIAIARVVLKNAPILLLYEASSSIESESSRVVQEAFDTLIMGNKTTILIAH